MQMLSLHAAAERERKVAAGEPVLPFGLFVSTLIDACTGYLTAQCLRGNKAIPQSFRPRTRVRLHATGVTRRLLSR